MQQGALPLPPRQGVRGRRHLPSLPCWLLQERVRLQAAARDGVSGVGPAGHVLPARGQVSLPPRDQGRQGEEGGAGEAQEEVLGQTPADHKKSRVASARYFDQEPATTATASSCSTPAGTSEEVAEARTELSLSEMEAKRKRLLRKIELAKQGWTGVSVSAVAGDTAHAPDSLEDSLASLASGPYETIPSEEEEEVSSSRPAMGQLGDFISLAGYSSEDEEIHTDHRLI